MELNDAIRRIVGQHWRLLALCVVAGILLGLVLAPGGTTYRASARLVLDTPDPASQQESTVIADTAKAIVTSPSEVTAALRSAGADRGDPAAFAQQHVSVATLGTSGVLQLSVTDRLPRVAASVANALAAQLIRTRREVTNGETQQVLSDLDRRTADLSQKISDADVTVNSLNLQLASARTPELANALRAKRDQAERERDFLSQQRSVLESERVSLLSSNALRPRASIISPATPPAKPVGSHRLPYLVLGTLLGLILGLGIAGLIETIRPTLVGDDALASELDAALLGKLPFAASATPQAAARDVSARLRLAAEAAGVGNIGLLAVGPDVDLASLVESLNGASATAEPELATNGSGHRLRIARFDVNVPSLKSLNNGSGTGLVLVSPSVLKKTELADAGHLLRVTNLPLLGLITYPAPGFKLPAIRVSEIRGAQGEGSQ